MITSVFDLAQHQAAKSAPALIADDEQHFALMRTNLELQFSELTGRLDALRRSPGGKGRAASDRDAVVGGR